MKKLGTLKWKGETPAWLRVDLLNRTETMNELDVKSLQKEVERLKIEKADLAVHFLKISYIRLNLIKRKLYCVYK